MSQEYSRKPRRVARTQRNRPALVTDQETLPVAEDPPDSNTSQETISDSNETKAQSRLPGFFSAIKKKREGDGETAKEVDVTQARLARATRGKTTAQKVDEKAANEKTETPTAEAGPAARPAAVRASQRPASAFKTRYLIGIALYMLVALYIGPLEVTTIQRLGLEQTLTRFQMFGGTLQINTSTLVWLGTLFILLIVLAKFDLIPRSATGSRSTSSTTRAATSQTAKTAPPPMRQGVKGADDDLYMQYRSKQRREKKR